MFSTYSIYFADAFTDSVAWWSNPLLHFPIIWSILVANHFKNLENVGKNDFLLASFHLQLTMKLITKYWLLKSQQPLWSKLHIDWNAWKSKKNDYFYNITFKFMNNKIFEKSYWKAWNSQNMAIKFYNGLQEKHSWKSLIMYHALIWKLRKTRIIFTSINVVRFWSMSN